MTMPRDELMEQIGRPNNAHHAGRLISEAGYALVPVESTFAAAGDKP